MDHNQQALIKVLALLISKVGHNTRGGLEIFVSEEKLATIPNEAQIQIARNPTKLGYDVRYFPNQVLDIEAVSDIGQPSSELIQHPKADDPTAA